MSSYKIVFNAALESVHPILEWTLPHLAEKNALKDKLPLIEVALEEIIVNIIVHAYGSTQGPIFVAIQQKGGKLEVVFRDLGPLFNPLEVEGEKATHLEAMKIGGQGVKFIKAGIEDIHYASLEGMNTLTCRF